MHVVDTSAERLSKGSLLLVKAFNYKRECPKREAALKQCLGRT